MTVSDSAIEGISGALGGIIALTATYPLMTIATLQAVRQKKQAATGGASTTTKDAASTQNKVQDFVQVSWRVRTNLRIDVSLDTTTTTVVQRVGMAGLVCGY